MNDNNLYNIDPDLGFIDIPDSSLKTLNAFYGGRGVGKTFSILKHRIENAYKDPDKSKFIWLRDSNEVVKKIAAGNSLAAPIKTVDPSFYDVKIAKNAGNYIFTASTAEDEAITIGYLMSLSTFHNARGLSYEDVSCIVFDEFSPEEGTLIKKNQGVLFLNMYESINRNREMSGLPPVQIILLSNTNDVYSEILEDLGVSGIIEDMLFEDIKRYRDSDIWIEFLESSKFEEKKKNTFLYRINKNEKFADMALSNRFSNNKALIKRKMNLKASEGVLTLSHRYTLIKLADGSYYFKLGDWKNLINYDMDNDQEAILFRLLFNDKLRLYYIAGQMYFDSIYTQKRVLDMARI